MTGPQHLAAAGAALAKAEAESGPRGDLSQFNKHMRLHAAHLESAKFAFEVAQTAVFGGLDGDREQRIETLAANGDAWIAAILGDGAK